MPTQKPNEPAVGVKQSSRAATIFHKPMITSETLHCERTQAPEVDNRSTALRLGKRCNCVQVVWRRGHQRAEADAGEGRPSGTFHSSFLPSSYSFFNTFWRKSDASVPLSVSSRYFLRKNDHTWRHI